MRRVMCISGVRSEYFLQRSIFQAIMDHPDLALELVVTGAHLSPLHDYSVEQIEADGFPIVARIENLLHNDRDAARLKGAASQLQVLAHLVDERRPDILFAPTDREEAMTLALCGAYLGIPVVHYGAGDRSGHVDDQIRHAVSRLSQVLLAPHTEGAERLIKSGEEEWRVHNVGAAGLDRLHTTEELSAEVLADSLGVESVEDEYIMVIQHPVSDDYQASGKHMAEILAAVDDAGCQAFVSYPNSDPGSQSIIDVIESYRENPKMHIFGNIPDVPFVNLLRGAACLVGNSSMSLVEAPMLKLPAVVVGNRQADRLHAENVLYVDTNKAAITDGLRKALGDNGFRAQCAGVVSPYGDGHTGKRIAELLASLKLDGALMNKSISY